jgi:hypothetical protein
MKPITMPVPTMDNAKKRGCFEHQSEESRGKSEIVLIQRGPKRKRK